MIVYGSSLSPFVRKTLAFAAEKGVEVENRPVAPPHGSDEFREASPFGKMPAFRDGDFTVPDSSAIIHYLDGMKPDPELIPRDLQARARTIWFEEFADTIFCAAATPIFFNRVVAPRFQGRDGDLAAAEKAEKEQLPPVFDYIERSLPDSLHLIGDRLTLADIAVASPFANLRHLGIAVDPARYPRTAAFAEQMLARPSFRSWVEQEARMLAG